MILTTKLSKLSCLSRISRVVIRKAFLLTILTGIPLLSYGQSPTPFTCDNTFYQVIADSLNKYNSANGQYELLFKTSGGKYLNGGGYNVEDSLLYAIRPGGADKGDLWRIGANGATEVVGNVGDLTGNNANPNSGDIDSDGNLWIRDRSLTHNQYRYFSKVSNVQDLTSGGSIALTRYYWSPNVPNNIGFPADIVFIGGKLFGVSRQNLFVFDVTSTDGLSSANAFETAQYSVIGLPSGNVGYGAAFTDNQDRLFVASNDGDGIFLIEDYDSTTPTATYIHVSARTSNNDGFSCPLAASAIDKDIDGVLDPFDLDADGDGITDTEESGGNNPYADLDGDGLFAYLDDDDGTSCGASCTPVVQASFDLDGDGVPNFLDLDSDNDGIYDAVEAGHDEAHTSGVVDGAVGTDGIADAVQASGQENSGTVDYTLNDSETVPDGDPDFLDLDSDGDSCNDALDAGFTDGDGNGLLGTGTFGSGLTVDVDGVVTSASGYTTPSTEYLNASATTSCTFLSIAATDADKLEGDAGTTSFTFTVTRSGVTTGASSVSYA